MLKFGLVCLRRSYNYIISTQCVLWKKLKLHINIQLNVFATVEGAGKIYSMLAIGLKPKVTTSIETG